MNQGSAATNLIGQLGMGDPRAADALFPLVYAQLREMAVRELGSERVGHTLQPTALVHEAFLRLANGTPLSCRDQAHFMALAARVIRRILIDHARRRIAAKRGGGRSGTAEGRGADYELTDPGLLELDEAMDALRRLHERQARVVELRFFGGLTVDQIADLLGVSAATVRADWYCARAWLGRALGR